LSAEYAAKHSLELVDDARLQDIGVSAFKGHNVTSGALGAFLKAVEDKAVPEGSYLLVESLDRVTRQEPLPALAIFLRIINAGITLVTLLDGKAYRKDQLDYQALQYSIASMQRANEESQRKSDRQREVWKNKRDGAASKPLTKWCTAWLRLS